LEIKKDRNEKKPFLFLVKRDRKTTSCPYFVGTGMDFTTHTSTIEFFI